MPRAKNRNMWVKMQGESSACARPRVIGCYSEGGKMAKRNIFVESMRAELAGQVPEHLVEPLMRQLFGRKIARRFRRRFHCGARARSTGKPCRAHALENGRCKLHGGMSTGNPRGTRAHRRRAACPLDELAKQEAIGLAPPDRAIFILGLRGLAAAAAAPQRPPRDRSAFRTSRVRVVALFGRHACGEPVGRR